MKSKKISSKEAHALIVNLESRFHKNPHRHKGIEWQSVIKKIQANPDKLWSLQQMELSGGEPDVVGFDKKKDEFIFMDCSEETPKGRRSTCYDKEAMMSRKEHRPENNVVDMAAEMGIEVLTEEQYRYLQTVGEFDLKTSSWIKTPDSIRKLGGALFCDRRFDNVFVYHNGAQSYYAARGFRGVLKV
jgi:hypothetical protein